MGVVHSERKSVFFNVFICLNSNKLSVTCFKCMSGLLQ